MVLPALYSTKGIILKYKAHYNFQFILMIMLYNPCLTLNSSLIIFLSFSTWFSQNSFLVSTQTCKDNFFLRPFLSALNVLLLESHMASVLLHVFLYILPPQKSLSSFVHLSVCISYFNKTYLKEETKEEKKMILFKMSNNESTIVILAKCFLTKLILSYSLGTSAFYCFFG